MWKAKPSARIFIPDSKQKIPMKYGSVSSWGAQEKTSKGRVERQERGKAGKVMMV